MTGWDRKAGPWLTRYTPASAAGNRTQLICLPHAGGSATFFATFAREMPLTAVYASRLPTGVSIGPDERLVVIPGNMLSAAKVDIPDA